MPTGSALLGWILAGLIGRVQDCGECSRLKEQMGSRATRSTCRWDVNFALLLQALRQLL